MIELPIPFWLYVLLKLLPVVLVVAAVLVVWRAVRVVVHWRRARRMSDAWLEQLDHLERLGHLDDHGHVDHLGDCEGGPSCDCDRRQGVNRAV